MEQQPNKVTDQLIIEQAMKHARQSGWVVVYADCHVQIAASEAFLRNRTPDAWLVYMSAQPFYNANLQMPMPLGCRVQLLEGRLCAVNLYEPSDRQSYLR